MDRKAVHKCEPHPVFVQGALILSQQVRLIDGCDISSTTLSRPSPPLLVRT